MFLLCCRICTIFADALPRVILHSCKQCCILLHRIFASFNSCFLFSVVSIRIWFWAIYFHWVVNLTLFAAEFHELIHWRFVSFVRVCVFCWRSVQLKSHFCLQATTNFQQYNSNTLTNSPFDTMTDHNGNIRVIPVIALLVLLCFSLLIDQLWFVHHFLQLLFHPVFLLLLHHHLPL